MKNCPLCGSDLVFEGVFSIECGENDKCPNWTLEQSNEIKKKAVSTNTTLQTDFDFDDDQTDPYWPPAFI